MKIYISGPITGKPNLNRDAFARAAAVIRAAGHEAVNPHDLTAHLGDNAPWEEYMKVDIAALVTCDAILLLEGWQDSKGARLENKIARKLKLRRVVFWKRGRAELVAGLYPTGLFPTYLGEFDIVGGIPAMTDWVPHA